MRASPDRRPRQDFLEMGLAVGDRLVHPGAPDEVVTVASGRDLEWRGRRRSLTALTHEFAVEFRVPLSRRHWRVGDRSFDEIYEARYGAKGGAARR